VINTIRVAIGQFGAPTTVLNASLHGVLKELFRANAKVYGIIGGAHGLVNNQWFPLSEVSTDWQWLLRTPGAALKAGRFADQEMAAETAVKHLKVRGIDALIVIGGNGTMSLGADIARFALDQGYPLMVVGVPKTIDNDIVGMDHTPGFPSAANFVIKAVRDLSIDLEAMVGFEQVRVVEVMGRRCGWLAASASLVPLFDANIPSTEVQSSYHGERRAPIICLPERPLDMEQLLQEVQSSVDGCGSAMVVVSEGVRDIQGRRILQTGEDTANSSRAMFGGIGGVITEQIRKGLGFGTRYENLGLLQRCWGESALLTDRQEAESLGAAGAKAVLEGRAGVMAVAVGTSGAGDSFGASYLNLTDVAGRDRMMTATEQAMDVGFQSWLGKLVDIDNVIDYRRLSPLEKSSVKR
jgi:ATP-dependent phosphofructokinase / diphosphate-dependent phosphofructokinase